MFIYEYMYCRLVTDTVHVMYYIIVYYFQTRIQVLSFNSFTLELDIDSRFMHLQYISYIKLGVYVLVYHAIGYFPYTCMFSFIYKLIRV